MNHPTRKPHWFLAFGLLLVALAACSNPAPGKFSLTLDPAAPTLVPGGSVSVSVKITREAGVTGPIALSLEGAPTGVSGSFDPNPATGDTSTLKLEATQAVKEGSYPITLKGKSGDIGASVGVTMGVTAGLPPSTFVVDTTVKPAIEQLKPLADGQPRPVVAAIDAKGNRMDFLENEAVLMTSNPAELQAFLGRWNGKVLKTIEPPKGNPGGLKTIFHIRLNPASADAALLSADLAALDKSKRGDLKLSSQSALKLLALTAHEKATGAQVGLNMVFQGQAFEDLQILEGVLAGSASAIGTDSTNATTWPYMAAGTTQNINVADAWRAMERAGKLNNTVKVAVIDGGFFPPASNNPDPSTTDWPRWQADANEIGNLNPVDCSGGNPCPSHGTQVSLALAGQADNNRGAAGPASPVAQLILLEQYGDGVSAIESVFEAIDEDAKIINMSFGAPIPAIGAIVDSFSDATFAIANAYTVLMFAAAGNDGQDVDAEDCFIFCWEEEAWIPCESSGVICVGGLSADSNGIHPSSNFGNEDVEIFGPFCVYVADGTLRDRKCGTSFASPFVAGVAALVWAANPSLSDSQVRSILLSTAHKVGNPQRRVVHAFGAVKEALGGNVPPLLAITKPEAPGFGDDRNTFDFAAQVSDFESGCCTVNWSSNLDGDLGTGLSFSKTLSNGQHTLTATATDAGGKSVSRTKTLSVLNHLPQITLNSPTVAAFYLNGEYTFNAQATDFGVELPCSSILWNSSVATDIVPANGCDADITFKTLGNRTLTAKVTDQEGSVATTTKVIAVVSLPPSGPPQVQINKPTAGKYFTPGDQIVIGYTVTSDPGCSGSCTYTVVWKFKQGNTEKIITPKTGGFVPHTYKYFIWEDYFPTQCGSGSQRTGQLTVEVTDPEGLKGTYSITIGNYGCPA